MVRWHHQLSRHGFEQTLGDSEGQRSLVCCSPWGGKESDKTEQKQQHLVLTERQASCILRQREHIIITQLCLNQRNKITETPILSHLG